MENWVRGLATLDMRASRSYYVRGVEMHDPRVAANCMLDIAADRKFEVTNLALQKLLFFAHAISLAENKGPLINGHFEAWKFGPVQPLVYQSFKDCGSAPILCRAESFNPITRLRRALPKLDSEISFRICERVIIQFGSLSAGRLVDLTHAEGGPWHHVVSSSKTGANIGLRISDEVIVERHRRLKVTVTPSPRVGEPDEDSPFS